MIIIPFEILFVRLRLEITRIASETIYHPTIGCTQGTRGCGTTSNITRSSSGVTWPTAQPRRRLQRSRLPRPQPTTTAPCPPITRGSLRKLLPLPPEGRSPPTWPGTRPLTCRTSSRPAQTCGATWAPAGTSRRRPRPTACPQGTPCPRDGGPTRATRRRPHCRRRTTSSTILPSAAA